MYASDGDNYNSRWPSLANRRPVTNIDTAAVEFTAPPQLLRLKTERDNPELPASLSVADHPSATTTAAAAAATTRDIISVTDAINADNETLTTAQNTRQTGTDT